MLNQPKNLGIGFLVVLFIIIILTIFLSARPLGVSPDSTVYIEAARNLASGKGLVARNEPLTHYPPGYPIFLTLAVWLSGDVFPAANWLHAGLFLFNGLLVSGIVFYSSGKRFIPAILTLFFFFISLAMIQIHSMAWSEGLFIFLGILSALMLSLYLFRGNPWWLVGSGVFMGAAILTRYIGIVILPTTWACLLCFNGRPWQRKWTDVGWISLLAVFPSSIFLLYNSFNAGTLTGRSLAIHFPGIMQVKTLLATLFDFWLPIDITRWIKLFILVILTGLILWSIWANRKKEKENRGVSPWQFVGFYGILFILFYLFFLAFSLAFLDAFTPLDRRILSPVLLVILILLLGPVWKTLSDDNKTWIQLLIVSFIVLSLAFNLRFSVEWIRRWKAEGMDYSNTTWSQMAIVQKVMELGDDIKIYSNAQDVFIFLTKKAILRLPYKSDPTSLLENPDYSQEMQTMCLNVKEHNALIVMIVRENWRWYYPTIEDIYASCGHLPSSTLGEATLIGKNP